MGEPVPCPNCEALLRLPAGAKTVRCPNCKLVLEIEADDAPPPPPPVAVPLPFGRPTRPVPAAKPVRPAATKARLAPSDPYTPAASPAALDEEEREREVRRQLRLIEAEEERKADAFDELSEECEKARLGLKLVAYGALLAVLSALLAVAFQVVSVAGSPVVLIAMLGGGLLLVHGLLTIGGLALCLAGPREMRGTALAGVAFTLAHLVCGLVAAAVGVAPAVGLDMLDDANRGESFVYASMSLANVLCNLTVVTDLPFYAIHSNDVSVRAVVLLVIAAGFEFAKLSAIGLLANQYATAGKDPELAHAGMRFVYRIFALLIIGPVVKLVATLTLETGLVWIPLLLATVGYFLWWCFAWLAQYQVLLDVQEIVTPVRLIDARQRYDAV